MGLGCWDCGGADSSDGEAGCVSADDVPSVSGVGDGDSSVAMEMPGCAFCVDDGG